MAAEDVALAVFVALPVVAGLAVRVFFRRLRARGGAARSRWTLLAGNLLVLAFLVCLAMLAGECWLRFVYDGTDSFDSTRASMRWLERHYEFNADSFRDDVEYDLGPVPAGRRRVTFLGDSFTVGHGVPEVADRFSNRIRAARTDWDVHVFAIDGWDTGAEIDFVSKRIPAYTKDRYAFDEVVLVYCLNDICDVVPGVEDLNRRLRETRAKSTAAASSYLLGMLRFLWIVSSDDEIRGYFPKLQSAYDGAVWEKQKKRLAALRDAVASRGGRFSVVTWPMVHRLDGGYPFKDAHDKLRVFWAAQGVPHLDLLGVLEGHDARDLVAGRLDAHPNEEANRIAADAMLPFLDAEIARGR